MAWRRRGLAPRLRSPFLVARAGSTFGTSARTRTVGRVTFEVMTFDAQLSSSLQSIYAKPTPAEALAIVDVARLAAAADKKTDLSEQVVLLALTKIVCEMAGMTAMPDAPKAIDPKRLMEIGEQLVPQGARELAYASAFLIMVQDLEVTKEESQM